MRILDYEKDREAIDGLLKRRTSIDDGVLARVRDILRDVEQHGDEAVMRYTREYDCPDIDALGLKVQTDEIKRAYGAVDKEFLRALKQARRAIARYHKRQRPSSFVIREKGLRLEQRFTPLERVGIYVPGGKAAYPSTVLMNAIPAQIAGVRQIVMTTPAGRDGRIAPEVLVAAAECGVSAIYRIGGAQAVGALAFGTATVPAVDKITGPGNAYVAAAKQLVYGRVGIDMIAGPTEVVVIADETADPVFVAADLIAQAEHDQDATPIAIVTCNLLIPEITAQITQQLEQNPRRPIAAEAFERHGLLIVVPSLRAAAEIANAIAPEHLEIMTAKPRRVARSIRNAGAIFVGCWTTEALGDYVAGPNHTLPTSGTARFSSALSVYDFLKFSNVIESGRRRAAAMAIHGEVLAKVEGLYGHAASMALRRRKP